jgi:hypothetical protein
MVLSMPAPHGPEDAAPQYQNLFMDVKSHRYVLLAPHSVCSFGDLTKGNKEID